jgi:hypothetical protein
MKTGQLRHILFSSVSGLGRDQWYNLTLEEKVIIQPHEGWANIQVILRNNENESRDEYSGFLVEHVEIRPVGLRTENTRKITSLLWLSSSMG